MWRTDTDDERCTCVTQDGYFDSVCPVHDPKGYAYWQWRQSPEGKEHERRVVVAAIKHAKSLGW